MLREIKAVKQERGPGRRRWFESDGLDLVVWLGQGGDLTGFQLCYDLGSGEHALTWREENGFVHSTVDSGDQTAMANLTPILEPAPQIPVPWKQLAALFEQRGRTLEPDLCRFIAERIAGETAV